MNDKYRTITSPCPRCRKEFTRAAVSVMTHCSPCMNEITQRKCRDCGASIHWCFRVCTPCSTLKHLRARYLSGGVQAQTTVARARRQGILPDPKALRCVDCGGQAGEYDHRDYGQPLTVEAVCRGCNVRRGKAIPKRWGVGEWPAYVERCIEASRRRLGRPMVELRQIHPEATA